MSISIKSSTTTAMMASLLLACGGEQKEKRALGKADGVSEVRYAASGGAWTLVQEGIQTGHPYADNQSESWEVVGSEDAVQMRVVFDRFELEEGYDVLDITGADGQRFRATGVETGEAQVIEGNRVNLSFASDYSVTRWGFRISVFEKRACVCAEIYQPVCGADGQTYGNSCEASCEGVSVAHPGQCSSDWFRVQRGVQSAHPYANNEDFEWELSEGGARFIRVHFSVIDLENGYDVLKVLDGSGRVVAEYTGKHENVLTPAISGSAARIQLVSDYSVTRYGFAVDYYEVQGGCSSDAECGAGHACVQVQCIRAPCFATCTPAPDIVDVTVDSLVRDAVQFAGDRVRVVAQPNAALAACTRRACSTEDPCCNRCSSTFTIGEGIELADHSGEDMGCAGNECTWRNSCDPFLRAEENGRYELIGVFRLGRHGEKRLEVESFTAVDCAPGGCSSQLCSNVPGVISTCEWRPEYACYQGASCAAQANGHCGWTETPALNQCLAGAGGGTVTEPHDSADTPLAIPDATPEGALASIEHPDVGVVESARVSVHIRHSYRGDLEVRLIAPDGREISLHNREGGSADDLTLEVDVRELAGVPSAGTWRLRVADHAKWDEGALERFSLHINP